MTMKPHVARWVKMELPSPEGKPVFRCNRCARQTTSPDQLCYTMEMFWSEDVIAAVEGVLRPAGWLAGVRAIRRNESVRFFQWTQEFLF